jgi:capsular polysaccharide biosynthesis protein
MSQQQPLDLRRSLQIGRRHKLLIGTLAAVGLLGGAGYAVVEPPLYSSQALLAIPIGLSAADAQQTTDTGVSSAMETEAVIAASQPVLMQALPNISPAISLTRLQNVVTATGLTDTVMSITAKAKTAAAAENIANAVANSYVEYVASASSPVGQVHAQVFEPAVAATGGGLAGAMGLDGVIGLAAGGLIGFLAAVLRSRGDRRLRQRDDIANSIGVPVVADIEVAHPAGAAGWTRLLDEYEPGPVQSWRLRTLIEQLGITDMAANSSQGGSSLTILSLSTDPKALALGPQVATFAAFLGIPTVLLLGPQQVPATAAGLRAACAADGGNRRSRLLRTVVCDDGRFTDPKAALIVVVVIDGASPRMPDMMPTTATLLGVSSGGATADQLASTATAAMADGHNIVGILVADPDPEDKTTGRVLRLGRAAQPARPNRLKGIATESRW